MMSLQAAARMALDLPEVVEGERHGGPTWSVGGKVFAWERSFSRADLRRFGDTPPPEGPILAVRVADLHDKEAMLAAHQSGLFTIPHFDGYAAVLVQLSRVAEEYLREVLWDGWLSCAPPALAREHLDR